MTFNLSVSELHTCKTFEKTIHLTDSEGIKIEHSTDTSDLIETDLSPILIEHLSISSATT